MRRGNQVILDGKINLKRVSRVSKSLTVGFQVVTDPPVLGGAHPVVASDDLALEVLAFGIVALAHKEPLQATVYGWLYSGKQVHVVADRVFFHVREELRGQAVGLLCHLRRDCLPEIVPVNGWRVSLPDLLGDVLEAGLVCPPYRAGSA